MKYDIDSKEIRIYKSNESCIFKRNTDEFGALSNMATKFPLCINRIKIKTSEALYQSCRFPNYPEIQLKIIEQRSPMTVKMISRANLKKSRDDWENVKLRIMKWCIRVKLAQNYITFGEQLSRTGFNYIVENSAKDNFWGAIPNKDGTIYTGKNALGRLLMQLRQDYYSEKRYDLLYVVPPDIPDFKLNNQSIEIIDERENFINYLKYFWKIKDPIKYLENEKKEIENKNEILVVAESSNNDEIFLTRKEKKNKKTTKKSKKLKDVNIDNLFDS